ncbi:MAG: DUF59 domain-containing protein [Parcubacteria group bacterium]|nr:DUF59 domain-containing protein [Parcubacteria group bacterium]
MSIDHSPTKESILAALKEVIDPELGINIVDLGLVYDVKIEKGNVVLTMTLTSPGCPLAAIYPELVEGAIARVEGVKKIKINLVWEPRWEPARMSEAARQQLNFWRR